MPGEREREVELEAGSARVHGSLAVPDDATGSVVFAHGSGSSRHSPRNIEVARTLNRARFATLLFDLLTPAEAADRSNVFDIPLLAGRLAAATLWLRDRPETSGTPVGYFGASTGAAAALWAASDLPGGISAVVSRGGRPDLAGPRLGDVKAPTQLLVGSLDTEVLELNREAAAALHCENEVVVIPGATHLFEEPGALEAVAGHAVQWFRTHMRA